MKRLITFCLSCLALLTVQAQNDVLEAARQTNNYFMAKYSDPSLPTNVKRIRPSSLWTRAVYYEGLMALQSIDPQARYIDYAERWANAHQWTPRNGVKTTDADDQCCEQTYIELHLLTGKGSLDPTRENLERQMASARCDYWTWIDAIQMALPVYIKMYAVTHDQRYLDYGMQSYTWSRDTCGGGLFNLAEGLWWRDKDYVPPYKEKDGKNCYWSRGNGWVYAALVRSMQLLSEGEQAYAQLKADFLLMSEALLKCQHADGFWRASLVSDVDYPDPEMTGTALFLYGMSWGIRQGLLPADAYRPACDKAWQALQSCLHPDGFLGWNQGTGKDPSAGQPVTFTSVPDFEDYGTGCYLLGLTEYYRLLTLTAATEWPYARPEAKPGTRWWWLGSAVDADNLRWNIQQYADHGIGAVEITPIYGVQGNTSQNIPFLSTRWMQMLQRVYDLGRQSGVEVDMSTGTGWPFGGPWVPLEESAQKMVLVDTLLSALDAQPYADGSIILPVPQKEQANAHLVLQRCYPQQDGRQRVVALYARQGVMRVKRAAPGGEGWVVDHFDRQSVAHYLRHIEEAFERTATPYPHTFFNDSYEVETATWTPSLLTEFQQRRGYSLADHLPALMDGDPQVVSDYRETLSDLLLEHFTRQWTSWAHSHGAITRNQAHGSPANLIDCYAAVDIPEIEGFGLSDFGIQGLRTDSGKTRPNDSDFSMLKYAPSAAHICGKPFTSSETFTWLTEHFRTSLSQLKPDLDLMFCAGVNHIFFHGTCYSPQDDPWPGWKFYASIDMSPTNSIWRDAPFFMQYVERCQRFLQWGEPDNDFLVLLPVRDMWRRHTDKLLMQFSIHKMGALAPEFRQTILDITQAGFDCDYISERLLMNVRFSDGALLTEGGTRYRALVIPGSGLMPDSVKTHIEQLQAQGARIIYGANLSAMRSVARPEPMKCDAHLKAIRRKNPDGHHYFIANLSPHDCSQQVSLAVPFSDALWFNPLDGSVTRASISDGKVHISLRSGQSMILRTFSSPVATPLPLAASTPAASPVAYPLSGRWTLSFTDESPRVAESFRLDSLQTWESLSSDSARVTMGTGIYTTHIRLKQSDLRGRWTIDLGDVRESARVYINDHFVGCAWSVPFVLPCGESLRKGDNEIRIEVTNLPANRIAHLDRRGVKWRKMEEINVVDIHYKRTTYQDWLPVKSGLNSQVKLLKYPN